MLRDVDEPVQPSHIAHWGSDAGLREFQAMVNSLFASQAPHDDLRRALEGCLIGADFVSPSDMQERVHEAAQALASRLRTRGIKSEQFDRFTTEVQPSRPSTLHGSEGRERGELAHQPLSNPHQEEYAAHVHAMRALRPRRFP